MCWVVVFSVVEPFVKHVELFSLRGPPIVFACLTSNRYVFLGCWWVALLCFSCWGVGVGGVGGVAGLLDLVGAVV